MLLRPLTGRTVALTGGSNEKKEVRGGREEMGRGRECWERLIVNQQKKTNKLITTQYIVITGQPVTQL